MQRLDLKRMSLSWRGSILVSEVQEVRRDYLVVFLQWWISHLCMCRKQSPGCLTLFHSASPYWYISCGWLNNILAVE